jgi:hypothetical protein
MQFPLFAPLASPADSTNLGLSKTPDYLFFILVIAQVNNHAPFPLRSFEEILLPAMYWSISFLFPFFLIPLLMT